MDKSNDQIIPDTNFEFLNKLRVKEGIKIVFPSKKEDRALASSIYAKVKPKNDESRRKQARSAQKAATRHLC